tara:strand:+ start:1782 stop:2285 length:504 start_codon:yes stop_codon:yes gene_type:complete
MKTFLKPTGLLILSLIILNSCTTDKIKAISTAAKYKMAKNHDYYPIEKKALILINNYRFSEGLAPLKIIDHISSQAEKHIDYMITNAVVNHNGFTNRSENIIKVLGAEQVGENVAYNYNTPEAVLTAWLNSPGHRENIVGDYTHFGICIKEHPETGKKYYTNIFAKI